MPSKLVQTQYSCLNNYHVQALTHNNACFSTNDVRKSSITMAVINEPHANGILRCRSSHFDVMYQVCVFASIFTVVYAKICTTITRAGATNLS